MTGDHLQRLIDEMAETGGIVQLREQDTVLWQQPLIIRSGVVVRGARRY